MAKRKTYAGMTIEIILWIAGIIFALGLGALFINGSLMNTFLGFLPLWVHQFVGWISIIGVFLGALIRVLSK